MLQGATRNLLPYATGRQNIAFARLALSTAERRDAMLDSELLGRVGLEEQADQVVSTMSGGQRQRLALACVGRHLARACCSPTSPPASSATRTATTSCT